MYGDGAGEAIDGCELEEFATEQAEPCQREGNGRENRRNQVEPKVCSGERRKQREQRDRVNEHEERDWARKNQGRKVGSSRESMIIAG